MKNIIQPKTFSIKNMIKNVMFRINFSFDMSGQDRENIKCIYLYFCFLFI
jgi:hypothetical protein